MSGPAAESGLEVRSVQSPLDPRLDASIRRRRSARRGRLFSGATSLAVHGAVLFGMFLALPEPPKSTEVPAMSVALVPGPRLAEGASAPAPPAPEPVEAPPKKSSPRLAKKPAPPEVEPLPAAVEPAEEALAELSESDLAGASTADSGSGSGAGGGGGCNMTRWLQTKLRKDVRVQAAVADAHRAAGATGSAMMVWNGDWVRSHGQDGKGLGIVREAIMWEVAFAPEACRAQPVHGLVLISLNDSPGFVRLAVGGGVWRWTDLLTPRAGVSSAMLSR